MLQDYKFKKSTRYKIPCKGWIFSAKLEGDGCVLGLHDQDYIHNGKKLINLLDSPLNLQLGHDLVALEHVGLVYNRFNCDEHGLQAGDVEKENRQNWASIQRLCQKKVQIYLQKL